MNSGLALFLALPVGHSHLMGHGSHLYRLCFEHVDNWGAYSIPSEIGLLISSVFNHDTVASENGLYPL
jgi:hypothetical protein